MGLFTKKIKPSSVSGDVEMQTIRPHKQLGSRRLVASNHSPRVASNHSESNHSPREVRRRLAPNRGIYRQRVKTSKCRKVKRTACARKRSCKYTHGPTRRYCRKRRNQRV